MTCEALFCCTLTPVICRCGRQAVSSLSNQIVIPKLFFMQTNILWTGVEYHSMENCLVEHDASGARIRSTIVGFYEGKIYQADYHIETNAYWETVHAEITCRHNNHKQQLHLNRTDGNRWMLNGAPVEAFTGCIDIDIPLTPLTNTLPIRRLRLKEHEAKEIRVLYCDLLAQELRVVQQKYTRTAAMHYHYENVPNDFEATIAVDAEGFVVDYPQLFVHTAVQQTNY